MSAGWGHVQELGDRLGGSLGEIVARADADMSRRSDFPCIPCVSVKMSPTRGGLVAPMPAAI
ncbi:uncharacterized protein K452DRAFT_291291 [Aplosporella prunicola CBS 121167]|uniref:Uncharacterized protein n=1 Tax=Aplosporella prunicola CBS 121167 TaxID=1176127 RepID=A0A6A6B2X9_9PEZI|nr:uncharacterized protein K452DRAFT_291291 [Aplosporella prunicola CBS 121167]KAF2137948.1 hypothetical protein K452DRAFT_291291 [Aplosporella prunicola CBS 121167]